MVETSETVFTMCRVVSQHPDETVNLIIFVGSVFVNEFHVFCCILHILDLL